ncbi:hypothetical protein XELAEV_18033041mg [Xenopus laevis]|uniref:Uncharacterized protein n=1 Tax=Xenopus laevis TaxID=8355 RepID=A0A974CIU0_XENLA|nr:hypothetical protein XELAEV_18033041mg [Xenopus laevis]
MFIGKIVRPLSSGWRPQKVGIVYLFDTPDLSLHQAYHFLLEVGRNDPLAFVTQSIFQVYCDVDSNKKKLHLISTKMSNLSHLTYVICTDQSVQYSFLW